MWLALWIAICVIACILKWVIIPKVKGIIGEKRVAKVLNSIGEEDYKVINDIMLPTGKGTTQIDHIVLSKYGIFVIETKNYKGKIYGGEFSEEWTQRVGRSSNKFFNPLKQNYGHIATMSSVLSIPTDKFIGIVVFVGSARIKVKASQPVIYLKKLKKTVLQYQDVVFSEDELKIVESKIEENKVENTASNRFKHIKTIKTNVREDKDKVANNICPKCGALLTEKDGKYGKFVACSNYPNCHFTKN